MKRRFYQLDVFTTKPYAGNPLAVITDGDGLSTRRMQAIAREMNLSETVFVQKPASNRALARLRIFTTTRELPLAGHPVIGTWFLLAELGVVPAQEGAVHIWQQTGAGILPVEIVFHAGRPQRVTMTQKPAQFRSAPLNRAALARALGLGLGDFEPALPLEYVSTGIFNLMVPLRRRAALGHIHMEIHWLKKLISDAGVLAYCFALGGRGKAFARGMIPWELHEDPATGSAGGSLGAYLVRHGRLGAGRPLEIIQGVEMGRPSRIHVTVSSDSGGKLVPRVSGSAVSILAGHLEAGARFETRKGSSGRKNAGRDRCSKRKLRSREKGKGADLRRPAPGLAKAAGFSCGGGGRGADRDDPSSDRACQPERLSCPL